MAVVGGYYTISNKVRHFFELIPSSSKAGESKEVESLTTPTG